MTVADPLVFLPHYFVLICLIKEDRVDWLIILCIDNFACHFYNISGNSLLKITPGSPGDTIQ
jgi:hypothetical protein